MTPIDDSNTHDSENTPPGYWFGELNTRLRDRMRDELHELDLGRRGWRVLHTLADGPATADQLADALPHRGRRGRGRAFGADLPGDAQSTPADGAPERGDTASARREWRGRPDWMRREWERRQQMYRAWMDHDNARVHDEPGAHAGHDHDGHDHDGHGHGGMDHAGHDRGDHGHDAERDTYGPDSREGASGTELHDHDEHHEGEHHEHEHHHGPHDEHGDHHPHPDHHHHGAEQAFERGFERGFVRGVERGSAFGHGGHGFGPGGVGYGGFGYGGFGPGRYGRPFGPGPFGRGDVGGRFGPDAYGHERSGQGRPPFAGRHGFDGRCRGGVDRILADFVERGWVWFDGDRATLTDEGRAAHDAAFERIRTVRASVAEGIDPADLATTLATLEAMARNLGWTPAAQADATAAGESATTDAAGTDAPGTDTSGTDTSDTEEGTDAD
ncbi:MarR family winged helix-turn-helix transcriptional regulator [Leifsonia shinshuensis]|uniref:Winged helix-turn-helix transcriptional regulator n=1 Tax=Leifsonia shinshuensis TaxID=150026 RepID=A0A7G6YD85_9MICO|nr:MarR family winged helix-turn-helix transcriptional regulator [Leifsonia shinshuensis]QNE36450.1 winged helix-turn-helix transcriptional regulator [Leifsonia shinshuensis]